MFKRIIGSPHFETTLRLACFGVVVAIVLVFFKYGTVRHFVELLVAIAIVAVIGWLFMKGSVTNNQHPCAHGCGQKGKLQSQTPLGTPEVGRQRFRLEYHCLNCGPFHRETVIDVTPTTN